MQDHRELLVEIRDTLVQHAKVHADWIAHQRQREVETDRRIDASIELQRSTSAFYRRTVLIGTPIVILAAAILLLSLR